MDDIKVKSKKIVVKWKYINDKCAVCGNDLHLPPQSDINNDYVIYNNIVCNGKNVYCHRKCLTETK